MILEIWVLAWHKHNIVAGLNRLHKFTYQYTLHDPYFDYTTFISY